MNGNSLIVSLNYINFIKTKCMVFSIKSINKSLIFLLKFDNYKVENVFEIKFLIIIINQKFNFRQHLDVIHCKDSKILMIFKYSYYLPSDILDLFIIFYTYLTYRILIWGYTYPSYLKKIFLLQEKVTHNISRSSYLSHTTELFKSKYFFIIE